MGECSILNRQVEAWLDLCKGLGGGSPGMG